MREKCALSHGSGVLGRDPRDSCRFSSPHVENVCTVTQIRLGEGGGGGGYHWGGGGRRTENRDHIYIYIYICMLIYDVVVLEPMVAASTTSKGSGDEINRLVASETTIFERTSPVVR